jgi:uncharacterized OB-fold protein
MTWNKPLPHPTTISAPYWEGLKAHEVRLQQCDKGHWLFFPRTHCPTCGSRQLSWRAVSGEGALYSFTVARVPTLPEFTDEMPQLLAVVELQEGVHINTTMVGVEPSQLQIGQRVRPVFDERPGSVTLLRYTPVESKQAKVIASGAPEIIEPEVEQAPAQSLRQIDCKDMDAMQSLVSEEYSAWSNQVEVTQDLINQFATIAHGALVQVLISRMKLPLDHEVVGFNNIVNYGSDRLRFPSPVPSGCRIHTRYRVKSVLAVKSGTQVTMEINVHVVGQDRPSVINDLVMLYM